MYVSHVLWCTAKMLVDLLSAQLADVFRASHNQEKDLGASRRVVTKWMMNHPLPHALPWEGLPLSEVVLIRHQEFDPLKQS